MLPLFIILTVSLDSDRLREFWKNIILGVVFAGLGFGFFFGLLGTLDFKAVITFILGCFVSILSVMVFILCLKPKNEIKPERYADIMK